MPISIDRHEGSIPIQPDTNEETLLRALAANPGLGFAPKELVEQTDVSSGSVHKTLQRLVEKGLARKTEDGYYYVNPDRNIGSLLQSIRALDRIHTEFEGDWFDRNPHWADDLPDLGTETVERPQHRERTDEPIPTDDLSDLGTESTEDET